MRHAAAARAARLSLSFALGVLALGGPSAASGAPACAARADTAGQPPAWAAPLDRIVSFHAYQISLREALDRLAAAGRLRLSYSPELVPLDRVVCASFDSVPVGVVLTSVLDGTAVRPVIAATDHVVLTPARSDEALANLRPIVLDRIIVTGSPAGGSQRSMAVALNVLDGQDLARGSVTTLSQALDQAVPGIWLWEQSPSSVLAGYGSIRGASSFGLSYPKVYIDGIEVANPLLVSRVIPEAIERVEVIRGPQGAALYGADAISGVTNIVTRIESADGGAPRAGLESGVGLSNTSFSSSPVLRQDYLLNVRAGSNTRSAALNLAGGEDGAFVPGAYARRIALHGSARDVGSRTILTSTLRVFAERTALPTSPLLPVFATAPAPQSVTQYTAGSTLKFVPNDRWTHTVVAGVDGYTLSAVQDGQTPIPTATDSALSAARGSATRGTLRLSSVARVDLGAHVSADLTLAADQSLLHQATVPVTVVGSDRTTTSAPVSQWRSIGGISALASATLAHHLFLSGGLRGERASTAGSAAIPMAGAAWAIDRGPVTVKLRAAYGEGIRWPEITPRPTLWEDRPATVQPGLLPERQSGLEAGLDFIVAHVVTLQLTRFDQIASGLIQPVAISSDTTRSDGGGGGSGGGPGRSGGPQIAYQFQNVGEIANRGWEMQGSVGRGPFSFVGTLSLVDSRVRQVAAGYTGDLAPGDRMLGVPARMMSATASWTTAHWFSSITAYRAEDWMNYDRLALARAFAADTSARGDQLLGRALRAFWLSYPGVTHLRATASWFVRRGLALRLTGDNLLNRQTGEPDNITVLPGRTVTLGLHSEF